MEPRAPTFKNVRFTLDTRRLGMPLVRECGFITSRRTIPLQVHRNPGFEITLAATGQVRWEIIGGPTLEQHGGEFSVMQPRLPHRGALNVIQPADLFYVVVDPARGAAGSALSRRELRQIAQALTRCGNHVFAATDAMLATYQRLKPLIAEMTGRAPADLTPARLRAGLTELLLLVADAAARPAQRSSAMESAARHFIRTHLREPIPVERLAQQMGLRRSQFSETFRRVTGFSPGDFIQRTRCASAAELLASTDLPVTQVALQSGFSSSQYFARAFAKFHGTTPRAYRRQQSHPN